MFGLPPDPATCNFLLTFMILSKIYLVDPQGSGGGAVQDGEKDAGGGAEQDGGEEFGLSPGRMGDCESDSDTSDGRRQESSSEDLTDDEDNFQDARAHSPESVWSETPIRDIICCYHPLSGVPYLRLGPGRPDAVTWLVKVSSLQGCSAEILAQFRTPE